MSKKKDEKEVTVVAELIVTWNNCLNHEKVKSFERAWVLANEVPRPATIDFLGFVRLDK